MHVPTNLWTLYLQESDSKVGMQQKLAAELLSKEEILGKMQMQIRDLTKNIKLKLVINIR